MRRPRHREKSNLLWKMLGVAGAINLVVWPVLIHEGASARVHQEILVPVSLIAVPPSTKLPDALRNTSRVPPVVPPVVKPVAAVAHTSKQAVPVILTGVKKSVEPKAQAVTVASNLVDRQLHTFSLPKSTKPSQSSVVKPKPPPTSVTPPSPHQRVTPADQVALSDRIAHAKQLEAEGHLVAEQIARQRAAQTTPVPSVPDGPTTVAVAEIPGGGSGTPPPTADTVAVITHSPPKTVLVKPLLPHVSTLAVAVTKAYPSVPDRMMTSSWHATFRGRFMVHADGTAMVQLVSSTGHPILDRRAMDAARRWKFRPARRNGKAVASSQPFVFEYDVHAVR